MALSRINSNSIADGTVIAADILDGTISTSKLVAANIAGDRIAANTLSNTVFQTGSVENYMRASSGGALSGRNRIINGAMVIDQRNAGASVTPGDGTYTLDRFHFYVSQSAKLTCQQNVGSVTPPVGFSNYLGVTSSSSYSAVTADYFGLRHLIEGFNFADLAWGTSDAKPVTLSFWVRSSLTGTFGGSLANSAGNRSYPYSYTISVANTWEQKIITIPGDTTGTWVGATNGIGVRVNFGLGAGSTFSGTAGSWAGTNYNNTTGAVSVVGTNGATWYITGVQLEAGSQATPFEYRQYGTELALCQRYYQTLSFDSGYIATGAAIASNAVRGVLMKLDQIMRTAPTITLPTTGTGAGQLFFTSPTGGTPTTVGTNSVQRAKVDSFQIEGDGYNSSYTSGNGICLSIGAGAAGTITASAEL